MFSPVFPKPRDILPFTIKLPEAIASAKTQKELEEVAQLGAGTVIFLIALWFKLILLLNNHSFDFASLLSEHVTLFRFVFSYSIHLLILPE